MSTITETQNQQRGAGMINAAGAQADGGDARANPQTE
jgi:hypothetical protein